MELEFQTSWKWPNYNVFVMADGPFTSDPTSFFLTWNLRFRKFSKINIQLSSSGNSLLIISICWEAGLTQSKEILCPDLCCSLCGEGPEVQTQNEPQTHKNISPGFFRLGRGFSPVSGRLLSSSLGLTVILDTSHCVLLGVELCFIGPHNAGPGWTEGG